MKKFKTLIILIFKISPSYIFLLVFNSLFTSLQIVGNVMLPKYLINELIKLENIQLIFIYAGAIVLFNLMFGFINRTFRRLVSVKANYVDKGVQEAMAKKIMNVEYRYLEDPYYLDLKERASFAITNQDSINRIINFISAIVGDVFTLIALTVIIISLSYILFFILIAGIIITFIINALFKSYQTKFYQEIIPINRKFGYYFQLSFNDRITKDMRLYKMSPLILNRVKEFNYDLYKNFKKYFIWAGLTNGLNAIINALTSAFSYLYISIRVISNRFGTKISIGDYSMYVASTITFTKTFNKILESFTQIVQLLKYLDPLIEFMELKDIHEMKSDLKLTNIECIEFRNVTFKYPNSDTIILDNISFTINKREKVSIVGLNGAGKTTLIKLICRFYHPTSGEILVNGENIFAYDYNSYIGEIAAVFQDYRLFAFSIIDNISGDEAPNIISINKIINQVGLNDKINDLPNGMDTLLNKAYDEEGTELSGGQNQKIAIARALYKQSSLVILDEPTSALDPIAEAEIYEKFNELVTDRTAIYISHRMSSSVFCDKVLVIDNGKLVNYDTHQNLMKLQDSLYFQLFSAQSKNYRLD